MSPLFLELLFFFFLLLLSSLSLDSDDSSFELSALVHRASFRETHHAWRIVDSADESLDGMVDSNSLAHGDGLHRVGRGEQAGLGIGDEPEE